MVKKLFVYFNNEKVGILKETKGSLSFEYLNSLSKSISIVLPNNNEIYKNNTCQKFFSNLLPEGNLREEIAKHYGVKEQIFPLLEKIGGECAGAISFYEEENIENNTSELEEITFEKFIDIMNNLKKFPLGTSINNRLSLAGMQEKFTLYIPYININIKNINLEKKEFYKANNTNFSNFIVKKILKGLKILYITNYFVCY